MNISKIDLNLLLVLDAVCVERNTVKAAAKLGLSQPAVSHALRRLRDLLGDRLFVRASRGLVPTPRALELAKPARELIETAEKMFFTLPTFDPASAVRTFRIATTDYFEQLALPELLQKVTSEAPQVTIISRPTMGHLPEKDLELGNLDFAIAGFFGEIPDRFFQQKLYQDDFVCIAKKGTISEKSTLSVEKYAELKHLLISPQGDLQSRAGAIAEKKGFKLQYVAGVTSFLSPAPILSSTDLVLTCPRKLALSYCEHFPLKIYELPFKIPPIHVVQVWHEQRQDDIGHQWLRKILKEICGKI